MVKRNAWTWKICGRTSYSGERYKDLWLTVEESCHNKTPSDKQSKVCRDRKEGTEFDYSSNKMTINKPILAPTIFAVILNHAKKKQKLGMIYHWVHQIAMVRHHFLHNKFKWLLD